MTSLRHPDSPCPATLVSMPHLFGFDYLEVVSGVLSGAPRRGQSVPCPAFGGAMLTLLRLPF